MAAVGKCKSGKAKRYESRDDAEAELLRILPNGNPLRRERRVYACRLCHGWHLTSQVKRSRHAN